MKDQEPEAGESFHSVPVHVADVPPPVPMISSFIFLVLVLSEYQSISLCDVPVSDEPCRCRSLVGSHVW